MLSCFVQKINLKPTDFQSSYRNTHGWNDGWFKRNQPCSYPHIGCRRLVLRKPTAFQPLYIIAYSSNDGWFCKNQPRSNLRILKHMVGMTVGFTKTNRHLLVVLYEGRNTVGFLSIFCTNQPVGIGLVDSWTTPRGNRKKSINVYFQRF